VSDEAFRKPATITCRACGKRHGDRYLCDPIAAIVKMMMDAAEAADMTVTELAKSTPLGNVAGMLGDDTVLCRQIVVKAGVVPFESAAGQTTMTLPALIFTGHDADSKPLPQWVFAASPHEMRMVRDTVDRMTEMAIRRAEAGG
jgi:hypothetical protein